MTGDKAIRRSTIAAVAVVAIVAGWVSYRHALQVVSQHGETGMLARAYPITIDGLLYSASMVLLNAARQQVRAHWLAYLGLGVGIAATLAANVAAGLAYGITGAIVAAWPAGALVISYESLMLVIRSGSAQNAPDSDEAAQVALDSEEAARNALAASIEVGSPLSQRKLIANFGLTRSQAVRLTAESSNGHVPAGQ